MLPENGDDQFDLQTLQNTLTNAVDELAKRQRYLDLHARILQVESDRIKSVGAEHAAELKALNDKLARCEKENARLRRILAKQAQHGMSVPAPGQEGELALVSGSGLALAEHEPFQTIETAADDAVTESMTLIAVCCCAAPFALVLVMLLLAAL